jgi:hypothetical protein
LFINKNFYKIEVKIKLIDVFIKLQKNKLKEYILNPPQNLKAVFLVTHRKSLINELLPLNFNHIRVGDKKTLEQVLNEKTVPTDPEILFEKNIETRSKLSKILND